MQASEIDPITHKRIYSVGQITGFKITSEFLWLLIAKEGDTEEWLIDSTKVKGFTALR